MGGLMKIIGLMLLTFFLCFGELNAHELAGQGGVGAETRQRVSSAVSIPATGNARESMPSVAGVFSQAARERLDELDSQPPFPVLTPRAIVYPRKAVRKGWEGQTVVAAEVLPDGSVGRTALAKTSGHEVLDQAAQESIKEWKFETGSGKGDPVPKFVDIPVTFKIQNED